MPNSLASSLAAARGLLVFKKLLQLHFVSSLRSIVPKLYNCIKTMELKKEGKTITFL